MLESESMAVASGPQPRYTIDEEDRVVDEMFFEEFRKENLGKCFGSRRKYVDVKRAVRDGIDSNKQLVSLIVELDHSLIDHDAISTVKWL